MKNVLLSVRTNDDVAVGYPVTFSANLDIQTIEVIQVASEAHTDASGTEIEISNIGSWIYSKVARGKIQRVRDCDIAFKMLHQSLGSKKAKVHLMSVWVKSDYCYFSTYLKNSNLFLITNRIPIKDLVAPDPFISVYY